MTVTDAGSDARKLGAYSHVDKADSENLVARLDAMHTLTAFQIYKQETFDLLCAQPGHHVADVGCGTGEDARAMASLVAPAGRAVGLDLSEAMLAQARTRHADVPGLSFQQASADAIDLEDGALDAIRADRVLIHVPDPQAALAEMIRVVKPGGRVVISEPDMPGCWVASSDYATTDAIMRQIANSCITPYLARDLMSMFRDAGLTDVSMAVRPVLALDAATVGKILDFESVVKAMLSYGLLSQEQVDRWLLDFSERDRAGRFAAGVNIMVVSGTKP
jgi:ubiquinone/menaquinone biosynthesis C-methylase UbiE